MYTRGSEDVGGESHWQGIWKVRRVDRVQFVGIVDGIAGPEPDISDNYRRSVLGN